MATLPGERVKGVVGQDDGGHANWEGGGEQSRHGVIISAVRGTSGCVPRQSSWRDERIDLCPALNHCLEQWVSGSGDTATDRQTFSGWRLAL